jgi:sugar lactone lactonase YvrE
MTDMNQTTTLLDGLMFPEAPRWHAGALWFTDQHARRIVRLSTRGEATTIAEMDDLPGGLGWLPDGRLLVVSMTRRRLLQLTDQGLSDYADLSSLASFHCNDMLVDPLGRCYVGNFGYDLHAGAARRPVELIRVDTDGSARIAADGLIFPNGCALTPDRRTLLVAETFASRISAFRIQPDGSLGQRRIWAELGEACPDGICLDRQGHLWIAAPNLGQVWRVAE